MDQKVARHGNKVYSKTDIDVGTNGISISDWEAVQGKEYIGATVISTPNRIKFTFGNEIVNNPGYDGNSMWFAFNTDLKAKSITPYQEKGRPKQPEKQRLNSIDTKPMSFLFLFRTKKSLMVRKISMI